MSGGPRSPYQVALGDDLVGLHPRLRAYFAAIPPGRVGAGEGTFSTVGTPRRWLWPALWLLGRQGVLFPVWEPDVPFSVLNTPTVDAAGHGGVDAVRTFRFRGGERSMVDSITTDASGLVDRLGTLGRLETRLRPRIVDGALHLDSVAVVLRLAGLRLALWPVLAPRVSLVERFDDETDRQQVRVTVSAPVLGRLYEYAGSFRYSVQQGESAE